MLLAAFATFGGLLALGETTAVRALGLREGGGWPRFVAVAVLGYGAGGLLLGAVVFGARRLRRGRRGAEDPGGFAGILSATLAAAFAFYAIDAVSRSGPGSPFGWPKVAGLALVLVVAPILARTLSQRLGPNAAPLVRSAIGLFLLWTLVFLAALHLEGTDLLPDLGAVGPPLCVASALGALPARDSPRATSRPPSGSGRSDTGRPP